MTTLDSIPKQQLYFAYLTERSEKESALRKVKNMRRYMTELRQELNDAENEIEKLRSIAFNPNIFLSAQVGTYCTGEAPAR